MLETFQEHTLDTALLKPGCTVLDVGCRGFGFGNELRKRFHARVYEVDIDDLGNSQHYYRCGIAAADGYGDVSHDPDPLARQLVSGDRLNVWTIKSFSEIVGVAHWDAIKLDCEGGEYEILWNLEHPPADQITVEFHQHTPARRSKEFMAELVQKLRRWYNVRQHRLYGKPNSLNYWDSLFILRNL